MVAHLRTVRSRQSVEIAWVLVILIGLVAVGGTEVEADDLPPMSRVEISDDGSHFVLADSGETFTPWGFNYLGRFGELIEESWAEDWPRLQSDFREMKKLGANVVRVHLQFGTYMSQPNQFNQDELTRLKAMLDLAQDIGVYLDLTGLSCYRLQNIPAWYEVLDEAERWEIQARWWGQIARTCAGHPAVFCYDLMNEPVVGGKPDPGEPKWVGGELGGFYFVQRLTDRPNGRSGGEIAQAWVAKLTAAIRDEDAQAPITVGVIPWNRVWPSAKPLFYSPEIAKHLDFVSIHTYPDAGQVDAAIAALAAYDIGKPLVIEETFPLSCTLDELDQFIEGGQDRVDGWISHYFGYTIDEYASGTLPDGAAPGTPMDAAVAEFLKYWRDKGSAMETP